MSVIELITQLNDQDIRLWLEDGQLRFSAPKGGMTDTVRDTLKHNKADIIDFLQQSQQQTITAIETVDHNSLQPLSYSQERIWFLCQLEPDNSAFHLNSIFDIRGEFDIDILEQTLNEIVRRHGILRTAYKQTDTGTFQQEMPHQSFKLRWEAQDKDDISEEDIQAIANREAKAHFDLETGDVTRNFLLKLENNRYLLFFTIHHIATDGWSMAILIQEIASIYYAIKEKQSHDLPEFSIQYIDFAAWQRQHVDHSSNLQQLQYWRQELEQCQALTLPTDRPRPSVTQSAGGSVAFKIDKDTTQALNHLAQEQQATLFMTLLSLFGVFLHRFSQQSSFAIGTPVAGRSKSQLEPMIGCFVNMVAIRNDYSADQSFIDVLTNIKDKSQKAFANQDVPFEKVVQELVHVRDLSVTPIFQTLFTLQNTVLNKTLPSSGMSIEPITHKKQSSLYDLSFSALEWQDEILAEFDYKTELFEHDSIEKMVEAFQRLVKAVVASPDKHLCQFDIVNNIDRKQQLNQWQETQLNRETEASVHAYFEKQALLTPNKLAVKFGDKSLSYQELNSRANQLAHFIIAKNNHNKPYIGVSLMRSLELPIALLACLKAGCAYVPFDPDFPAERLNYLQQDTGINILISHSSLAHWEPAEGILRLDMDYDSGEWQNFPENNPNVDGGEDALFNVIYTSGSTGNPKGVMVPHSAIINRICWMQENFPLNDNDRILQKTPYSFDVSVWEIFWPLMFGSSVVFAKNNGHKSPNYIRDIINREQITTLHFVPSMLGIFLQTEDVGSCASIRRVFCSGEKLSGSQVDRFLSKFSKVELYNLYGPTEAAIDVSYYQCRLGQHTVPIGMPISNTQLYILDDCQQLLPNGAIGEIYIGGDNLAKGYLNLDEASKASFIDNPFYPNHSNCKTLYRTGDLGRFDDQGLLYYIGRLDQQIKVRGFRVELGEIESSLQLHPTVQECIVIAKQSAENDMRLYAYYIAEPPGLPAQSLRDYLLQRIPEYMIPNVFIELDAWPLTNNGKIDRQALPDPDRKDLHSHPYVAPRNEIEQRLANTWAELLNIEKVGIYDNFFEIGGHSLIATVAIARLQKEFHVNIPLSGIFKDPTIATIAKVIADAQQHAEQSDSLGDDEEEITL